MQNGRLFEMVYMLMDKDCITAGEFAAHFEISTRTVYRDVELLAASGIPIYMQKGKGGGISLLPDFVLNKTVLTAQEKEEVLSALSAFRGLTDTEADSVLNKLGSLLGEANGDWLEVDFGDWNNHGEEIDNFNLLKPAVIHKKVIEFTYYNNKREESNRIVEPMKLLFKGQAWYLYGYCRMRQDYRFFKLKRMKKIQILEERFELREQIVPLGRQDSYYREKTMDLVLLIAPELAFRVYDEFEDYTVMENGSFLCKVTMPEGEWLFSYLASFGEKCEILLPESLREQMKEKVKRWLNTLEKSRTEDGEKNES